ncbi:hypothetical protein GCM10009789_12570 [Kribbella sancticallisti]|uniref:GH10 domain-containing protein n=2 Tax=Kribbella sancticallisti TaxID=460087 RepID=A0ABN2CNY3_9ACTN
MAWIEWCGRRAWAVLCSGPMRIWGVILLAVGLVVAALAGPLRDATAEQQTAATEPGFTDSFDGAVDRDPTYGLNDGLVTRQAGPHRGITYTRVPGVWYAAPAPRPWYSQVNHAAHGGRLSFWLGTSAVRLEAPVTAADGLLTAAVSADPVVGDTTAGSWTSLVLSADRSGSGYVTDKSAVLAVLVRSSGGIQVFHRGRLVAEPAERATPDNNGSFRIRVTAAPGRPSATVQVGAVLAEIQLGEAMPSSTWLHLGAYLANDKMVSTFDDLAASAVGAPVDAIAATQLRYFGYFAARITEAGGNHLPEIKGRTNLNWVNISDFSRYAPEVLEQCAPNSCIVYTGHEFFTGCDQANSPNCDLYANYRDRWLRLAKVVEPYLSKIAGFYLKDEPYHRGASPEEVAISARTIKETYPDKPVMMVEAGPKVTDTMVVPADVDWVGFDWYCEPIDRIERTLRTLESRTTETQRLFLLPQTTPLKACGTRPGYQTDAELTVLQRQYADLAARHPRVIGLMGFGLWVEATPASSLPLTLDVHERFAARILVAGDR